MNQAYFKEYFHLERSHWWFTAREEILKSLLPKLTSTPQKILNVGAATGRSTEWLSTFGEVTSIEYDPDCCNFVNAELNLNVTQGSITDLPYESNSFDVVCAFDVIEHVEDDQTAVDEMRRVSKTGGILYITVPAFMFLWSEHDEVNQHYRRYSKAQILRLLPKDGSVLFASYFNSILFIPISFFRVIVARLGIKNKKRKDAGSDFFVMNRGTFLQKILFQVFRSEKFWLTRKWPLPFGVSVLCAWKLGS